MIDRIGQFLEKNKKPELKFEIARYVEKLFQLDFKCCKAFADTSSNRRPPYFINAKVYTHAILDKMSAKVSQTSN